MKRQLYYQMIQNVAKISNSFCNLLCKIKHDMKIVLLINSPKRCIENSWQLKYEKWFRSAREWTSLEKVKQKNDLNSNIYIHRVFPTTKKIYKFHSTVGERSLHTPIQSSVYLTHYINTRRVWPLPAAGNLSHKNKS